MSNIQPYYEESGKIAWLGLFGMPLAGLIVSIVLAFVNLKEKLILENLIIPIEAYESIAEWGERIKQE